LSSPPHTPAPATKRISRKSGNVKTEDPETPASAPKSRKRARPSARAVDDSVNDLPHNLGELPTPSNEPPAKPKKGKKVPTPSADEVAKVAEKAGLISPSPEKDGQSAKKKKNINYKLTPGTSPYPGYNRPTKEECHEVVRLLSKVHGTVSAPKEIRPPSLEVAGCGEVPSVLDALIRTRLSAATTNLNSSRAFQGLVKTFGTLKDGVGKGSVDWNAVRLAPVEQVFEAIKCGGLAGSKSKDIKAILDLVWAENLERAKSLSSSNPISGSTHESPSEQTSEITKAHSGVPNLDHLHLLSNEDAFNKLVSYPGIGPKTASCVLLFCLQRPSFAVDTHVFRLCRYLAWVPSDAEAKEHGWPKVERNSTYSHCEVMVPDELKYALHQLLIKHGKTCGRCRAATGMGSEGWKKGCPIEHLVKRHGAKKGG
ncbi:DNA glycosylase, partial [Elsinoe ampelina]